jgi:hypothetical protein
MGMEKNNRKVRDEEQFDERYKSCFEKFEICDEEEGEKRMKRAFLRIFHLIWLYGYVNLLSEIHGY